METGLPASSVVQPLTTRVAAAATAATDTSRLMATFRRVRGVVCCQDRLTAQVHPREKTAHLGLSCARPGGESVECREHSLVIGSKPKGRQRVSQKATVPRGRHPRVEHGHHTSVVDSSSSLPAPCASSSAAWLAATAMNPLPPRAVTARCRAVRSGSSGRGNGIRSMITSDNDGPGTSTPCHSDSVPNNDVSGSAANCSTRAAVGHHPDTGSAC